MELEDLSQELKKGQVGQTILWRSGLLFIFFRVCVLLLVFALETLTGWAFWTHPGSPVGRRLIRPDPLLASTCEHVTLNSISAPLFVCVYVCFPQVIVLPSSLVLLEKPMSSARLADTICHLPSSSVPTPPR